jgi:putative two-component system response regulator
MAAETILVVEDNEILLDGLKILLEDGGFNVITAVHGQDALHQMESTMPDLILADIIMPVMDGYEFFKAVRECSEWVSIPIIFLTARRDREDIFLGKSLGADDYLIKPVSRVELIRTVKSRLARQHQLLYAQMQESYESSLIMLANAVEARDGYGPEHVESVLQLALILARQMELTGGQQIGLRLGAILHDVGKIYIQERILHKPGPLDDEEWNEVKKHPEVGAEMLKDVPQLTFAIPVILHHHEHWDGSGYPKGLKEEAIPLGARIVAVADSYTALTSERVFRPAWSAKRACKEILTGSESQFDPKVVAAFQHSWESGIIH